MKRRSKKDLKKEMENPEENDDLEFEPDSEDEAPMNVDVTFNHKFKLAIPFPRPEWAEVVRTSLEVDKELKPTVVRRTLEAQDGVLHVTYEALDVRMLRTVVSSFFDMLLLVMETIKMFGEEAQPSV